jgi:hypothetical protein
MTKETNFFLFNLLEQSGLFKTITAQMHLDCARCDSKIKVVETPSINILKLNENPRILTILFFSLPRQN